MEVQSEVQESTTITFEWTLKGLKNLFDSTKGESKSKVTKSVRFGGGRWQILFYANAGTSKEVTPGATEGGYVSLYLSCEPTTEEKEAAMGDVGKWTREGIYKFSFELRNIGKTVLYNLKEAHNHSFSHKTANWGWHGPIREKRQCVLSNTRPPPPVPAYPRQSVPKGLLDTVGALLDDPLYSDVEFIIPRRGGKLKSARRIWASRRMLKRAEYFESSGSGFAEGSPEAQLIGGAPAPSIIDSDANLVMNEFEDSDDDDDFENGEEPHHDIEPQPSTAMEASVPSMADNSLEDDDDLEREDEQRNVRAKLSHPSSPRSSQDVILPLRSPELPTTSKFTVVVKDVAYSTYLALQYYVSAI
ncbi:hypothetical protein DXG03_003299 [Asterophora parasitica]|uniref:MATH domain-containing protein n=1 Tax=Asterophora parasitica TaxID=117018 RepID=A0A9P7G9J1_9AGAR|nr:hypothetical protein DXG03_003299 [Asterophora parasitica]